jgi:uncharacterized membrane protein
MKRILQSRTFFVGEILVFVFLSGLWFFFTLPGFYNKLSAIGYAFCHQIRTRSFMIGTEQFAFCHRCTGLFLGIFITTVWQLSAKKAGKIFTGGKIAFTIFSLLFFIIDIFNSSILLTLFTEKNLYMPSILVRTISGLCMGTTCSLLIHPIFNCVYWKAGEYSKDPLGNKWVAAGLLVSELLILGLIFTKNIAILTIFDLLSSLAAFFFTACLYTTLVLLFFRLEIQFTSLWQGKNFLLLGILLALIQINSIELLRYHLTGSWYWPV